MFYVSVSSDGRMVAFVTQDQVQGDEVWVLRTGSAPGGITARARKVYRAPADLQPRDQVTVAGLGADQPGRQHSVPRHERQLGQRPGRDHAARVPHGGRSIAQHGNDLRVGFNEVYWKN